MKDPKKENSEATKLVGLMYDRAKKVQRDGDEFKTVKAVYNRLDKENQSEIDLVFEALCGYNLAKLIKVVEQ